ncbi:MAG: protein kinase [Candidatus Xenobiia bacterium LiM19]
MNDPLPPGTVLRERYRISAISGEGAAGIVYVADDLTIPGARWAIKEMRHSDEEGRQEASELFDRERRILSSLNHTGLPKVVDYFSDAGRNFTVMEFIEGESLENRLSAHGGPFTAEEIMPWVMQIMDILEYLHTSRPPLVYRDLKPSNVVITSGGKAKLIDFGIVRAYDPDKKRDTQIIGTPGFSAPEQYGTRQTDQRSDIYSLGATIFYLMSGRDPGELNFTFPALAALNSGIPSTVSEAVATALQKEPEKRFQSIPEMREFLRKHEPEADTAAHASPAQRKNPLRALSAHPDNLWKAFWSLLVLVFFSIIPLIGPLVSIAGFAGLALLLAVSVIAAIAYAVRREWKNSLSSARVAAASLLLLMIPAMILSPAFKGTEDRQKLDRCRENLKAISTAVEAYARDQGGSYPSSLKLLSPDYLKEIPICPSAGKDTYSETYESGGADNYTFYCRGSYHRRFVSRPDYPRYSGTQGLIVDPSDL